MTSEQGTQTDLAAWGPELTARVLREWCERGSTATAYIEPRAPWQNPWIESFNGRVRDELLDVEELSSLAEAQPSPRTSASTTTQTTHTQRLA